MSAERQSRTNGADKVVIERVPIGGGQATYVISDEGGEFARADREADALRYAADLLYGPGTSPRGTVWNLLRSMEDTDPPGSGPYGF